MIDRKNDPEQLLQQLPPFMGSMDAQLKVLLGLQEGIYLLRQTMAQRIIGEMEAIRLANADNDPVAGEAMAQEWLKRALEEWATGDRSKHYECRIS